MMLFFFFFWFRNRMTGVGGSNTGAPLLTLVETWQFLIIAPASFKPCCKDVSRQ